MTGNGGAGAALDESPEGGASATPDTPQWHALGAIEDSLEELTARRLALGVPPEPFPTSIDLSDRLPLPGDQGNQNSSLGWAVGYAIKTYYERTISGGKTASPRYQFSPAWIYNQIVGEHDIGAKPSAALNLIEKAGADTLRYFPYTASDFLMKPDTASMSRAARFKGATWGTLEADVETIKNALAAEQPLLATFRVFSDLDELNDNNQIYDSPTGYSRGRQAVVLVGYDDRRSAFKFMNSWGRDWGLSGYGWLDYDFAKSTELKLHVYSLRAGDRSAPTTWDSLYIVESGRLWRTDNDWGDFFWLRQCDWHDSISATALGGQLYIIRRGSLFQVNPGDGTCLAIGSPVWSGTTAMTSLGATLYITQGDGLWRIDNLANGSRSRVGERTWDGISALAAHTDSVYVIQGDRLYRINAITGKEILVGEPNWSRTTAMVALSAHLYVVREDGLWQIDDLQLGSYHRLGSDDWSGATSMTQLDGRLYIIQAQQLWEVDTTTGVREGVGRVSWFGEAILTALP